ncbi:unnamed protein product, partial [Adineta steineri]
IEDGDGGEPPAADETILERFQRETAVLFGALATLQHQGVARTPMNRLTSMDELPDVDFLNMFQPDE